MANTSTIQPGSASPLEHVSAVANVVAQSPEYLRFVKLVRTLTPWRFQLPPDVLERDYLRIVDHHLKRLLPLLVPHVGTEVRQVLDFGCGSGGSAIALALVYPHIRCYGTDIDAQEIEIARERARLYNVADRCEFFCLKAREPLPFTEGAFDLCLCSSVLEYATDPEVRRFCVQEMVRLVNDGGLLFFSVPNRLYPFEIHTGKWGWNYFPESLRAHVVDCTFWEVRKLARPARLTLHRTPFRQLLTPWTNFCVGKEGGQRK